jgi:CRP-like cAMP-binding protein
MTTARRERKLRIDLLRRLPLAADCTKLQLARLDRLGVQIDVPAGHVLTREGAHGAECFIVVDGVATVSRADAPVGMIGPGSIAGELALLYDVPRTATVVALTPMRVLALSAREFRALLDVAPCVRAAVQGIATARASEPAVRCRVGRG